MLQSIIKPHCLELFGSCLKLCGINDWGTGRQQVLKLDDCLALVSCHDSLVPDWVSTKVPVYSLVITHSSYAPNHHHCNFWNLAGMWICYFATPKTVEELIFLVSQVSLDQPPTATRAKLLIDVAIGIDLQLERREGEKKDLINLIFCSCARATLCS